MKEPELVSEVVAFIIIIDSGNWNKYLCLLEFYVDNFEEC